MKILIIIPSLGYGGAEKLVIEWIRNWLAADAVSSVTLVLYSQKYLERLGDITANPKFRLRFELTNTPWRMLRFRYLLHLLRLRRIIAEEAPDVVHSNLVAGIDMALLHRRLPRVKAFFHTVHGQAKYDLGGNKYRRLMLRMLRDRRCRMVAISSSVQRSIRQYYDSDSLLIPNGVQVPATTEAESAVAAEMQFFAAAASGKKRSIFLAVGRVMPEKNYDTMCAAFRHLQQNLPVALVVLGSFMTDVDRDKYDSPNDNIHFLGARDNVGDYMRHADFFCMTSLAEGFGLVVAEAMSVGLVPVITPTVGITDIIADERHGVIAKSISTEAFEDAVRRALRLSETEKEQIRRRNFELYDTHYRIEKCAAVYLENFLRASAENNRV